MASASAGLELPATSLIAPLLGRIAVSWREAPLPRALITRRWQGWQYDGQPGSGFVPVDSGDSGPPAANSVACCPAYPHGSPRLVLRTPVVTRGLDPGKSDLFIRLAHSKRPSSGKPEFGWSILFCAGDGLPGHERVHARLPPRMPGNDDPMPGQY